MGTCWIIASGKGGVGKSTVTSSLAAALTTLGPTACVVDADIGLRDQDAILGLENRIVYDLIDVCNKDCDLEKALIAHEDFAGLTLLAASQFASAKDLDPKAFRRVIQDLKQRFDYVLVDCPAGIERGLQGTLNAQAEETILICTPDDVCIRNAEKAASLFEARLLPRPVVIVNRLSAPLIEKGEMYTAQVVADTLDLPLMGEVP